MTKRQQRLIIILAALAAVAIAAALILRALNSNISFFYTPTQVSAGEAPKSKSYRLGGMVPVGSIVRTPNTLEVAFKITDNVKTVPVKYSGLLPDLFKEGKGVVVQGKMEGEVFSASEVLAKHDENYMPPEAAAAMEAAKKAKAESVAKP
jgi:cytochrome c-type biogenesis protein CcmE